LPQGKLSVGIAIAVVLWWQPYRLRYLYKQATRLPLQLHSCKRRNNSSSGNWMPM
jgi:hypothetical protein